MNDLKALLQQAVALLEGLTAPAEQPSVEAPEAPEAQAEPAQEVAPEAPQAEVSQETPAE